MPTLHVTYAVEVPYGLQERLDARDPDAVDELHDLINEQRVHFDAPVRVEFA